jgi:hypothetical protein
MRGGSQADFAPTELPRFFCVTRYKDLAPTEPFSNNLLRAICGYGQAQPGKPKISAELLFKTHRND